MMVWRHGLVLFLQIFLVAPCGLSGPLDTIGVLRDASSLRYPGGKNACYHRLINLMPPHDVYIEPFLGSGAVMRLKRPAKLNIGLDLVASQLSAGAAELAKSGATGNIAVYDGRSPLSAMEASIDGSDDGIRYRLFRGCAIALLETASPKLTSRSSLIYCDPPYLPETLSSPGRYRHMLSEVDHRRLLRVLQDLPCMVMLSGYWSSLYAERLKGWNLFQFEAMTRGGKATETVWFNYPYPVELHDYRYLGNGFRERERIKRKKTRWVQRLARMPILERQALLSALRDPVLELSDLFRGTSA
jgi:DNA adenine methylase